MDTLRKVRQGFFAKLLICMIVGIGLLSVAAVTQINLTTQVQGLLPGTNGGTGVSSTATYPASGTIMTTATSLVCGQMPILTGFVVTAGGTCATTAGTGLNFVENETPTGTCATTSLTLAHTPNPSSSLQLYDNGQRLTGGGADYSLSAATITLTNSCPVGTVFLVDYRY